jgi:hypothetical protein
VQRTKRANVGAFIAASVDCVASEAQVDSSSSHASVWGEADGVVSIAVARATEPDGRLVCTCSQRPTTVRERASVSSNVQCRKLNEMNRLDGVVTFPQRNVMDMIRADGEVPSGRSPSGATNSGYATTSGV